MRTTQHTICSKTANSKGEGDPGRVDGGGEAGGRGQGAAKGRLSRTCYRQVVGVQLHMWYLSFAQVSQVETHYPGYAATATSAGKALRQHAKQLT